MRKNGLIGALVLAMVALMVAPVQAALLPVGGTQFPAPGEPDPTGGVVVGAPLVVPFSVPGFFDGTLTSTAIANDPSNPFPGGLTFTYSLSNAASSPNAMARITFSDFTGFQTDTSYQTPAAGVVPTLIDRLSAHVIGYSYQAGAGPGPIFPGQNSALMVVQTDGQAVGQGFASVIDSGALQIPILVPIPEPAMLSLAGLAGLALIRRR